MRPSALLIALIFAPACMLLIGGCAETGAPPGGEPDVTGPRLLVSYPINGALGVVPDSFIRLQFSETVVKPDQGSVVFISPRPSQPPEIKWESDGLLIKLPELFRSNQTYVVSVNTSVTDLRRNRLDSAITIAFSTGQTLDSGVVGGHVLTAESKAAIGWIVGLYPAGALDNYQLADSVRPEYMTTVGGDGRFSLRHLPASPFSLLAFEDKNRDELFNPAVEAFAVPDREIVVGGALRLDNLYLSGTLYDSLAPEILSCVASEDRLLRVRLNRKINPAFLSSNRTLTKLHAVADTSRSLACDGVFEARSDETNVVTLHFPEMVEETYRLSLNYRAATSPLVRDSVVVKLQADDTPPAISEFKPGDKPMFVEQIEVRLALSEPIKQESLTDQSFVLWEGDKRVDCTPLWEDVFHLALKPERLAAGKKYRLDLTQFDIRDLSDNPLGDSLQSFSFATLDEDSVGSITGRLSISLPGKEDQVAKLALLETATKRNFTLDVLPPGGAHAAAGQREFALKVPPGKYLLSGFLDQDGDGRPTAGGIRPLRLSETRVVYPDTIIVRARFETAGTQLSFE